MVPRSVAGLLPWTVPAERMDATTGAIAYRYWQATA